MIKEIKNIARAEREKLEDTVREEMLKSTGERMREWSCRKYRPLDNDPHPLWRMVLGRHSVL